jgi:hypothetical protein
MTITIHLKGRLGNQLFQYATLRNISIIKGYNIYIDTNMEWHGQRCLLPYFNLHNSSLPGPIYNNYDQPHNSNFFDSNIYNINDNTLLNGYFENVEYFNENLDIIKDELTITDNNIIDYMNHYIHSINGLIIREMSSDFYQQTPPFGTEGGVCLGKELIEPSTNSAKEKSHTPSMKNKLVVIHFRLGDVIQQTSNIDDFIKNIKIFADKSLETILKTEPNITIIFIGGGLRKENNTFTPRNHNDDIDFLKSFASECETKYNYKIHISPGTMEDNEILDYYLITKCDYLITPYPSTFSFMAYYTSKNSIKLFSPTNLYDGL